MTKDHENAPAIFQIPLSTCCDHKNKFSFATMFATREILCPLSFPTTRPPVSIYETYVSYRYPYLITIAIKK